MRPRQLAAGPLDWSLIHGAVPLVVQVVGFCALVALCFSRDRAWLLRWGPVAVVLAGVLTLLLKVTVEDWWQPFPDELPLEVVVWLGVAILGVCLAAFRLPRLRWRSRAAAAVAAALVVLLGLSGINRHFAQYPTLRTMPGPWADQTVDLAAAIGSRKPLLRVPEGKRLAEIWHPPAGLPTEGTLSKTPVPGTKSGFAARDAYVYLPPAYRADPRPALPVLVLTTGQPGSPEDWVNSGQLKGMMDAFAAAHGGLAPVVVVADALGSTFANTLCMDSRIAKAQTYLAEDVPDWIRANLQVAADRTGWATAGYSFGGTCSVQLAVNAPQVYGRFIDIAGQAEPTLGSRSKTIDTAFGGDGAAYARVNPLDVLARTRFPDTAGVFVAGADDRSSATEQRTVHEACRKAGMRVSFVTLPGGHSWQVWRPGLQTQLDWLARETRLMP
ncbi:alpha/beta hydrolase [Streptomyces sp. URMC 123]|uniref:alpha/beta hydrolase n=1 Tax=Streptomyces sp. URMC 123 TaxID=3423403 RepID=UPI003F1D6A4E